MCAILCQDAAIITKTQSKKLDSGAHFSGEVAESESSSAPPSSCTLLDRMRERNHLSLPSRSQREEQEDNEGEEDGAGSSRPAPSTEFDELLADLRNFVAFQARVDGQASTQELLEYFTPRLSVKQSPVFRELLRSICDFQRGSGEEGLWRLKENLR